MTGPANRGFRCAGASEAEEEELAGTASTVRSFLLVEAAGAWGVKAPRAPLLPEPVRDWLSGLEARHRVRPLLVRRSGRPPAGRAPVTVFAAHTTPGRRWLESLLLGDHDELPGLDEAVAGVGRGRRPGWSPYDGSLFLTCTHGRHDACCAERGRPTWEALRRADPEHSWQVSHIGGDRYAANVVVLPEGLYYGRVGVPDAARLVESHRRGELLLDRLRGRTAWPFAVQAAEIFLRRAIGLAGEADVALEEHRQAAGLTTADFVAQDRRWQVQVRTVRGEPRRLTCSAELAGRPLRHELVSLV